MKKYIIILCMFLGLCGCGKSDNVVRKFQNKIEKAENEVYSFGIEDQIIAHYTKIYI